jgi:hypothetical protein
MNSKPVKMLFEGGPEEISLSDAKKKAHGYLEWRPKAEVVYIGPDYGEWLKEFGRREFGPATIRAYDPQIDTRVLRGICAKHLIAFADVRVEGRKIEALEGCVVGETHKMYTVDPNTGDPAP